MASGREAAYLALIGKEGYVEERFKAQVATLLLNSQEESFGLNIARGTVKMRRALDHLANQLTTNGKLPKKKREIELLRLSIYQHFFLDKIPLYALIDESVKLAKKYVSKPFSSFLNATLRRLEKETPTLPQGDSVEDVAIRLSYPTSFVRQVLSYPEGLNILEEMNLPPKLTARRRGTPCEMITIENAKDLQTIAFDPRFYVQNGTPVYLMNRLREAILVPPKTILDLSSAPGGKLLLAGEFFPSSQLVANDISKAKLQKITENLEKFQVKAELTCFRGEEYPLDRKFDLVIADLPCSNSGVLRKRADARWRLEEEGIKELQWNILKRAKDLLAPGGQLWYLTCSILKAENEEMFQKAVDLLELKVVVSPETLYPKGLNDGGFGGSLTNVL